MQHECMTFQWPTVSCFSSENRKTLTDKQRDLQNNFKYRFSCFLKVSPIHTTKWQLPSENPCTVVIIAER